MTVHIQKGVRTSPSAPLLYLSHPGVCRPPRAAGEAAATAAGPEPWRTGGRGASPRRQTPSAGEAGMPAEAAPRRPPSSRPTGWTGTARCWPERPCQGSRRPPAPSTVPAATGRESAAGHSLPQWRISTAPRFCGGDWPSAGPPRRSPAPRRSCRTAAGQRPETRRPAPKHPAAGHPHPTAADSRSDTGTPAPAAGRDTDSAPGERRPPSEADFVWAPPPGQRLQRRGTAAPAPRAAHSARQTAPALMPGSRPSPGWAHPTKSRNSSDNTPQIHCAPG